VKPSGTRARRISRSPRPPTGDSVEKDRHRTRARASAPSDQAPVTLCAPERSLRWCTRSIYGRRRRGFHEPCRPRRSLPPSAKPATAGAYPAEPIRRLRPSAAASAHRRRWCPPRRA